jgi:hypothetical protein
MKTSVPAIVLVEGRSFIWNVAAESIGVPASNNSKAETTVATNAVLK